MIQSHEILFDRNSTKVNQMLIHDKVFLQLEKIKTMYMENKLQVYLARIKHYWTHWNNPNIKELLMYYETLR